MVAEIIKSKDMPENKRKGSPPKYPWLQLQPGDAFKFGPEVTLHSAKSMASNAANGREVKFAVRECDDGVYCWRIDQTKYAVKNGNYPPTIPIIQNYSESAPAAKRSSVVGHGKLVGGKEVGLANEDDAI